MHKKVTLVVTSDLVTDQRIHKIASTLAKHNYDVTVIGRKKKNSLSLPAHLNYKTIRFSCWFNKGKWFYIEFQIRLLFFLLFFNQFDILNANDLDTLLPAFIAAKLKRKKLVYDAHEYFTQVPELIHRPFTQKIWLFLEKLLVPKLKKAITVNEILAEIYQKKYNVKFVSIYNVPFYQPQTMHSIDAEKEKILIYQGALNLGRGIELMIDTMKFLPEWTLWILGTGDKEKELKIRANGIQNIKFWGAVPYHELQNYTLHARIGLSLEEDFGENYRVATPNKVFDYIQARIPVIVSDLPGLRSILKNFEVGKILTDRKPENLAKLIKEMEDCQSYHYYRLNCEKAAAFYCWENQEKKLVEFYENL